MAKGPTPARLVQIRQSFIADFMIKQWCHIEYDNSTIYCLDSRGTFSPASRNLSTYSSIAWLIIAAKFGK